MRALLIALALALALAGGVALAAYTYLTTIQSRVEIATTLTPGLEPSPGSLDFAGLVPGSKGEVRTLTVTNKGTVTLRRLTIRGVGLPSGVTLLESHLPAGDVAPNASWTIWLQLQAEATAPMGVKTFTVEVSAE